MDYEDQIADAKKVIAASGYEMHRAVPRTTTVIPESADLTPRRNAVLIPSQEELKQNPELLKEKNIHPDYKRNENYQEKPTELTSFEGSATRSKLDERFDLIPIESLQALGRRLALGAAKHGERNWQSGGPDFVKATINHLYKHLADYAANGNTNDDNIGAIICNAAFLAYFEAKNPRKIQS